MNDGLVEVEVWLSVERFGLCLSEEKEGFDLVGVKEVRFVSGP